MRTTIATRAGRRLGQMAVVALVALLLSGLAAAPAEARTRDEGRQDANDFIAWCQSWGDTPIVLESSDKGILVSCLLPGTGNYVCQMYPIRQCHLYRGGMAPGDLPEGEIVQDGMPAKRPGLADPGQVGGTLFAEDESTAAPLPSSRIAVLGGSAVAPVEEATDTPITLDDLTTAPATAPVAAPVAQEILVPVLDEDDVVTTQPIAAPVAEAILVPEIVDDEVVTTQSVPAVAPVVEEIPAPALVEEEVVTTQPASAPVAEELAVPALEELEEDAVVSAQVVPVAEEQP